RRTSPRWRLIPSSHRAAASELAQRSRDPADAQSRPVSRALVRPGQLDPACAERFLELVHAVGRVALVRFLAGALDVDAAEVDGRPALVERDLDTAPDEQAHRARILPAKVRAVARDGVRQAVTVPVEGRAGDRPFQRMFGLK